MYCIIKMSLSHLNLGFSRGLTIIPSEIVPKWPKFSDRQGRAGTSESPNSRTSRYYPLVVRSQECFDPWGHQLSTASITSSRKENLRPLNFFLTSKKDDKPKEASVPPNRTPNREVCVLVQCFTKRKLIWEPFRVYYSVFFRVRLIMLINTIQ